MLGCCLFATPSTAETRVALVIGNANYQGVPVLNNPINDAKLVAASLRKVGFADVELESDLDRGKLVSALKKFAAKARDADVALVYFAGHGIEMGGINYLIPTDATLAADADVEFDTVPLDMALTAVSGARAMRLVVMDACRNNPFVTHLRSTGLRRAVSRGLAAIVPEGNTLVLFSAKDGTTAEDGEGANSPFAEAFASDIAKPIEIGKLMRMVRDDVLKRTGQTQEPYLYGSISATDFYFMPGGSVVNNTIVSATGEPDPKLIELEYWKSVRDSGDPVQIGDYITAYPRGVFVDLAKAKLASLRAAPNVETAGTRGFPSDALAAITPATLEKYPFLLGRPSADIVPRVDYKSIPVAGEFAPHDTRYVWTYLSKINQRGVVLPQCLAPSSYIVWFFDQDGGPIRGTSLRLSPTRDCQGDSAPYLQFLRAAGVASDRISVSAKAQTLRHNGLNYVVLGDPAGEVRIDILVAGFPLPDWAAHS